MITTNDPTLYEKLRVERNHGLVNRDECEFWSYNCRLDTIQAAMLLVKMNYLEQITESHRANAAYYQKELQSIVKVPVDKPFEYAVYHTFVIQTERRDELQRYLSEHGIGSKIHYPIPIHLQPAAKNLGYGKGSFPMTEFQAEHILSLPVYPELTKQQIAQVVSMIKAFYQH